MKKNTHSDNGGMEVGYSHDERTVEAIKPVEEGRMKFRVPPDDQQRRNDGTEERDFVVVSSHQEEESALY